MMGQTSPWGELMQRQHICTVIMGQCRNGLKYDNSDNVKKPAQWMANDVMPLKLFRKIRCIGARRRAEVSNARLEKAALYTPPSRS